MKSISLIAGIFILVLSFQNCAQDPYTTADQKKSQPSTTPGFFDEDDLDIQDDIGSLDTSLLPESPSGTLNPDQDEYNKRLLDIRAKPSEPSGNLYMATPQEYLLMTNKELTGLNFKLQEFDTNNIPVKNIQILFKLNDIETLMARVSVKDLTKNTDPVEHNVLIPHGLAKPFITSFKNIMVCEFTIRTDKPMCAQVVTPPHTRKVANSSRVLDIGYKNDKCPLRYIDICPSSEELHRYVLNVIGQNYQLWIKHYKL